MYEVGQVLFIVLKKKQKIVPVQVVEQIVRKSLDSESVQYLVKVPLRDEPVKLGSLNADVFTRVDSMRDALYKNVCDVIDTMAKKAVEVASGEFNFQQDISPSALDQVYESTLNTPQALDEDMPQHNEKVQVTFPDGTVGNVTLPEI